jgi:DNA polymerase I-like protein with 3'-5' exonuclease and polymerase domains
MSFPFSMMLVVDAETRWSSKPTAWSQEPYTLSKMTTEAYIRSPLFKAFGFCIHEYGTDKPTQWYSHKELPRIFSTYDWSKTAVIAHNAAFDVGIMSMVYGVKPAFIFDSLSMARALRGVEVGNSLMKLADAFGLPPKGRAVHSTDGLEELTPEIERELAEYCKHDVYLCEQIFSKLLIGLDPESGELRGKYPVKELKLIDMTLKMFTNPELRLDTALLEDAHHDEQQKLIGALERAGVAEADLASADKFSDILRQRGVEPPTKKSPATGLQIPALAKNDAMFQALLNGDDEDVALLCEARLRVKSTLERTRSQRFIDIASRGALPVPLKYYGAETGRYSAWDSINLQNMKRGSFLRKSIMAPEGKVLVVGDLSQIEPRVLAWLSDYDEMLDIFRSGVDAYAVFGAQMFNVPGMTKDSHPLLRQSAKSALLGCGYQLGWASFAAQLLVGFLGAPPVRYTKEQARQLGVTQADVQAFIDNKDYVAKMQKITYPCTQQELLIHCLAAKAIVDKYRRTAAPVKSFWEMLDSLIRSALIGGREYTHKCLTFRKEEIVLPSGMSLKYPNLRMREETNPDTGKKEIQYVYGVEGGKTKKLYAGRICNNVTQGVARVVMTDGLLRIAPRYPVKGSVHDEGIFLAPEDEAEKAQQFVYDEMTRIPKWMPGIPLDADVHYGKRYGDIK